MKPVMLTLLFVIFSRILFAQQGPDFKAGQPLNIEGVEFLYTLGPEEVKTIDGAQYSFYNLDWNITNKGKFSKIFLLEKNKIVESPEFDMTRKAFLAKIQIMNGLMLPSTKKSDVISSEPNTEIVSWTKKMLLNKKNFLDGFNLQSGQTLSSSITIAVPKGQSPIISLQPFLSPSY